MTLRNSQYLVGVCWAVLMCLVSNINDVLMRFLHEDHLPGWEITFFRFFFSLVTLLPFIFIHGWRALKIQKPLAHLGRAGIGVAAIGCAVFAVQYLPLAEVTTLFFTQPLFFMPMAVLFLGEKVSRTRLVATCLGFIGILIVIRPHAGSFNVYAMLPICGAILFALLDIYAKRMIGDEDWLPLLLTFSLGTTLAALIPALQVWETPRLSSLGLLLLLGAGANLIQLCLFKAFSAADAVSLSPYRYTELLFSSLFGYFLFGEVPHWTLWMGAFLIVVATIINTYAELGGVARKQ